MIDAIEAANVIMLVTGSIALYAGFIIHWNDDERAVALLMLVVAIYLTRRAVIWADIAFGPGMTRGNFDHAVTVFFNLVMLTAVIVYAAYGLLNE